MKILCHVHHYFGQSVGFTGQSTGSNADRRLDLATRCIEQLRRLGDIEIRVCGVPGRSLLPLDLEFASVADRPTFLIYESLARMAQDADRYDYFIAIEDDILLPEQTFANVVEFDRTALVNEVLHPNRIEADPAGKTYCVDTCADRRWTQQFRRHLGRTLRVAANPHSAVFILSRAKWQYVLSHTDRSFREVFLAHAMESAFAYHLSPMCLYRSYDDPEFHTVLHMDRWFLSDAMMRAELSEPRWLKRWKPILKDLSPPILVKAWRRFRERRRP